MRAGVGPRPNPIVPISPTEREGDAGHRIWGADHPDIRHRFGNENVRDIETTTRIPVDRSASQTA
jgi:hypothetical protein